MEKFLLKFYFVTTAVFLWSLMHNRLYEDPEPDDYEDEWSDEEDDDN